MRAFAGGLQDRREGEAVIIAAAIQTFHKHPRLNLACHHSTPCQRGVLMKYTLLGTLAAVAAAAALSAFGFATTAAAQDDKQPTHAELVQRWAEAAIEAQLKGMKTSLRLSADQEKLWGSFESAVKDGQNARLLDLQKEQSDNLSPMDRLTAKADRLTRSRANLEKIVEAAKPLYASLADEQKHKFITLGRMLVPERGSFVKEMRRLGTGKSDQHDAE
jgi:Spy/CpxP family protein refolding chaperone